MPKESFVRTVKIHIAIKYLLEKHLATIFPRIGKKTGKCTTVYPIGYMTGIASLI
jgi:hypothetical protein